MRLCGHFSLILLGEIVINRNPSGRNQTFLFPLLFFFETTRRLCRRIVSAAYPAKTYLTKQYMLLYRVTPLTGVETKRFAVYC